ncbi:MAG: hypothetical protein DI535_20965 [Citrobacter freundii]|nr:MAG: hypothetical protein DI535_20965 [Citrobacter freundii]
MADQSVDLFPNQLQVARKQTSKTAAKISLTLLLLYIICQFLGIYQTIYQLTSPIIPKDTIWEINKQFVFKALIASIIALIALLFYFFEKYIVIVILIILTLIVSRFILIKPWTDFEVMFF